ncbi:MAG: DUF5658 family protein [Vicinamibacterales bacterium]
MVRNSCLRIALTAIAFTFAVQSSAFADESALAALTAPTFARVSFAATASAEPAGPALALAAPADLQLPQAPRPQAFTGSRPKVLPALYASLAVLNVMDALTTAKALGDGAVEANPVMQGVAGNTPMLFAVKAASTGASIWLAERLWKKNRAAAIATMVAVNGFMAVVVTHNQSVINRVR